VQSAACRQCDASDRITTVHTLVWLQAAVEALAVKPVFLPLPRDVVRRAKGKGMQTPVP